MINDENFGPTPQEITLLDAATRQAQADIEAMIRIADRIIADHAHFTSEMARLRRERCEPRRTP